MSMQMVCVFVSVLLLTETGRSQLTLATTTSEVIEGSPVSLTCNYSGTNVLGRSSWLKNSETIGSLIYSGAGCKEPTHIDLDNYTAVCTSNESFTLTIVNVTLDLHNTSWLCLQAGITSNTMRLTIQVPVKTLSLDPDNLTIQENAIKVITCATSFSRPRANTTWYIKDRTGLSKVYLQESDSQYNTSATNPPNQPTVQCTNNGIYKVVQNTQGKLTCSVDGGNPAGTLHWNCTGDVTEYHGPNNNVTQTLVWTATQTQYCTCAATNIDGNRSISIKTELLYPPVVDALQDKDEFEGDSVTLQCVVLRSNPPVSVIRWTSNRHSTPGATLLISNISRTDNGTYTCTANNTMRPSCQDVVHGSASRSLHVKVLYPPTVNIPHGKSFTVKEGDRFSYRCPVEPGNPPSLWSTWRRSINTKTWYSSELLIHNVTRYDDSVYTCYASNVMVNSNGITRIGNVSADMRLIVQFRTNVTDFYIRGYKHNTSVTVMENTNLVFECHLHSNPACAVRMYEAEVLVSNTKANELLYHTQAMCSGGPVSYSCHGNNSLSNTPSTRQIQLIVTCSPRRDIQVDELVSGGAINNTVTLSYTVLAYPLPTFTWYRNGTSIDATNPRFIVSSTDFKTNLTITHILESDFGEYTLAVANNIGLINESFHIEPQGVPEVPTHLRQDNTSTTDSKIPNKGHTGTTLHDTITGLSSDTKYVIVLFAVNAIGPSKSNATLTCITKESTINELANTSQNISAIIGGTLTGVFVVGVIVGLSFVFRRRLLKDKRSESTMEPPVTYENLKIEQIPNVSLGPQNESLNNETPETNVDVSITYEGLARQDNETESEYTQLGNTSNDSNDDAKQTYENLRIQLSSCQPSYDVTSAI